MSMLGSTITLVEKAAHGAHDLSSSKCSWHRLGVSRHNAQADHKYHADCGGGKGGRGRNEADSRRRFAERSESSVRNSVTATAV